MNKKRILSIILFLCVFVSTGFTTVPANAAKPAVKAHAYVVMDANSGDSIYSYKSKKKIYPASTVKIMTAAIAVENVKLSKKIKFTKAMRKEVSESDIANLGLKVGTIYTVRQYLHMMLLVSDADSAIALAHGVAGSTSEFVKMMNAKAKELGMTGTSFDNPIGLDIGNGFENTYTTAWDFTVLARYAMANDEIRKIVAKKKYKVPKTNKGKSFTIRNTNAFYSSQSYDKTKYEIIGLKTGTTNAAGHVLIAVARDKEGHEVICSFFGKGTDLEKYKNIKSLLNYTFKKCNNGKITLHKGFWDMRFRQNEALITSYADEGVLKIGNGKFYPKSILSKKKGIALFNNIADTDITEENISGKLSAISFATFFQSQYPMTLTQEQIDVWNVSIANLPVEEEEKLAVMCLYESGIISGNITMDCAKAWNKEEIVAVADAYKKWLSNNSIVQ